MTNYFEIAATRVRNAYIFINCSSYLCNPACFCCQVLKNATTISGHGLKDPKGHESAGRSKLGISCIVCIAVIVYLGTCINVLIMPNSRTITIYFPFLIFVFLVHKIKYNLGRMLTDMDRLDEAFKVYHDAVQTLPDHVEPHSLYNMIGRYTRASKNIISVDTQLYS